MGDVNAFVTVNTANGLNNCLKIHKLHFQVNDACEDKRTLNFFAAQDQTTDQFVWVDIGEEIDVIGFLLRNIRNNADR